MTRIASDPLEFRRKAYMEGGRRLSDAAQDRDVDGDRTVSVITVVFNGAQHLRTAIESVLGQTHSHIEYIVVDGGSTDGSIDILREYNAHIDYWISGPDDGIYDAMNKGVRLAKGNIVGILNSDDCYSPNAVEAAVRALQDQSAGYCYSWARLMDENGRDMGIAKPVPRRLFNDRVLRETPLPHPTMFVRKTVYDRLGAFDPNLRLAGDFEFIARIHRAGIRGVEIPRILVHFRLGGASRNALILREMRAVALREGLSPILVWQDWFAARMVMAVKRMLPLAATGRLRALRDWARR